MNTGTEPSQPSQVTELLQAAESGRLPPMQTTALVHEAYVRLVDDSRVTSRGRAHFFAAAARAMRQVLIDAARRRGAAKRGAGAPLMMVEVEEIAEALGVSERTIKADWALARAWLFQALDKAG